MARAIQIDTLAFAKRLQAAGADERLAEAIVEGITDADTSSLATKEDVAQVRIELKEDIRQVETALKEDIAGVKEDIRRVETALKEDIGKIHVEIANGQARILMWLFGMIAAMTALFMGAVPFLIRVAIASLPVAGN